MVCVGFLLTVLTLVSHALQTHAWFLLFQCTIVASPLTQQTWDLKQTIQFKGMQVNYSICTVEGGSDTPKTEQSNMGGSDMIISDLN